MPLNIGQLDETLTLADADILHTRTAGGFDKKISVGDARPFISPHGQHLRSGEYTKTGADDKWTTILRTHQNVSLFLQITIHDGRENERLVLSVNGAEVTNRWSVNFIDFNVTERSSRSLRANPSGGVSRSIGTKQGGIYRIRWGDAGNGNGFCIQMQINYAASPVPHAQSAKIRVSAFGSQRTDGVTGSDFEFFGPAAEIEQFKDSGNNNILTSSVYTYYYTAFSELIRAAQLRTFAPDYTVYYPGILKEGYPYDDANPRDIPYIKPGIYNNLNIIFENSKFKIGVPSYRINMLSGKYVILGDFKITLGGSYKIPVGGRTPRVLVRIVNPDFANGYSTGLDPWQAGGELTYTSRSGAVDRDWFGGNASTGGISTGRAGQARRSWGFSSAVLPFANGKFGGGSGNMGRPYYDSLNRQGFSRGGAAPCGGAIVRNPYLTERGRTGTSEVFSPWARAGWAILNIVGKCDTDVAVIDASARELFRGAQETAGRYAGDMLKKWQGAPCYVGAVGLATYPRRQPVGVGVGGGGGGFVGMRVLEGSQRADGKNQNVISEIFAAGGTGGTDLRNPRPTEGEGGGGGGGIIEVYAYNSLQGMRLETPGGTRGIVDPNIPNSQAIQASHGRSSFYDLAKFTWTSGTELYNPSNASQTWANDQFGGAIINLEGGWWY